MQKTELERAVFPDEDCPLGCVLVQKAGLVRCGLCSWVNSLRLMSEEEESLQLGLSSYPLEVRFGSFKIIPDQKLLCLEDNHRKICILSYVST
jgi:hypothetical protein